MKIVALLSWYDEDPAWLTRCVSSLAKVPIDRLIALDGPYELYGGPAHSDPDQWDAIHTAAHNAGIAATVHAGGWQGNEVEKRNHLFEIAEQYVQSGDWLMVVDADEFVVKAPTAVHDQLASSPFDVAAITLNEPGHPLGTIQYATFPMFFRAIPGLRCSEAHFRYQTPHGRLLWGDAKRDRLEPRHDLTALVVEHHNQLRHSDRRQAALDYYKARDDLGLEDIPAERSLLAQPA